MQYIKANSITFCYEDQPESILENISFEILSNSKIGLIGKNGCGKTTILKLLQRKILPVKGSIYFNKDIHLGFLPQELSFSNDLTVLDFLWFDRPELYKLKRKMEKLENFQDDQVVEVLSNFEKLRGYKFENKIEKVISKFEFDPKIMERKISSFSGGEKTKIALCRIILNEPDILLLDEPTNHLDIKTLNWLENYLKKSHIPYFVISHDRKFLDNCVEKIWEVENKGLNSYSGNYSVYKKEKDVEFKRKMHEYESQQKKIRQLKKTLTQRRTWAHSHQAQTGRDGNAPVYESIINPARSAMKRAKNIESRIKHIIDKEEAKKPWIEKKRKVSFEKSGLKSRFVLKSEKLGKSYGDRNIFHNVTFSVKNHARLNISGSNGSGKSTLFKIITGNIKNYSGGYYWAPQTKIGYYSQEFDNLENKKTVIDEILQGDMEKQTFGRTVLGSFNIRNDMVYQKIDSLSIGERSKVALSKIITSDANILILDEPTNHLEISAREALEEALQNYDGTLIFVSHDRYLQERLATDVFDLDKCNI